ncbi:MAG TPA: hypothetical protein HPP94_16610, partial [Desulfuromonadales bacterium]|nr:hypothetical protein [Desulfuromonadales bacterium]
GRTIKRQPLKQWRFVLRAYLGQPLNIVFGRADQATPGFLRNERGGGAKPSASAHARGNLRRLTTMSTLTVARQPLPILWLSLPEKSGHESYRVVGHALFGRIP